MSGSRFPTSSWSDMGWISRKDIAIFRSSRCSKSIFIVMQIKVFFHSYFRELAGRAEVNLEVPAGTPLGSVVARLHSDFPKLKGMERSTLVAVGVEYQAA